MNVNCTCVCSIKLYWKGQKGKKEKYSEIRDQRYSVRKRRLLVKHEDSKKDDFCNDFNFGVL